MLRTEALIKFLHQQPYTMCKLYSPEMEVQVNVARGEGEPVQGTYAGLRWQGFTDGLQIWKHFRIPWNADRDPKYEDRELKFSFDHIEAIGMTGWDYINRHSRWVGFDFDALVGHKQGLTQEELNAIRDKLADIDFITIYTSTSGNGLHIYVFTIFEIEVTTHTEHAAIARSILAKISALTGLSLEARVDTLGGNMWVWHRKATVEKSYILIKQGTVLTEIPTNWRDYLNIVSKKQIKTTDRDDLVAARNKLVLDEDHLRLLKWFEINNCLWWFDDVRQMLVCHTYDLKQAHKELKLKGFFNTIATGKDQGHDQNCFAFPLSNGGWSIRRHTRGVHEHDSWYTDNSGWTTCYFNRQPNFRISAKITGGIEAERGYAFRTLSDAIACLLLMSIDCTSPDHMVNRPSLITELKDGRIKISFEAQEYDELLPNWIKQKNQWERIFFRPKIIDEKELPDHIVRHTILQDWFVQTNNAWVQENRNNIISSLIASGYKKNEIETLLGICVLNNWKLVHKPFQPEYPGNREWNKHAPQFRFTPERSKHPTWDLIFEHCGKGLQDAINNSIWARDNGIVNGLLYLQAWCAACFQFPSQPLPYIFFTGNQNSGKSIFHEALSSLLLGGYVRSDNALNNPAGFNGELANAILCVIEETNLSKRGWASDRIKDWVTGRTLNIHIKGKTPYDIPNTTHWIQCANNTDYCPVFPGDTRIVVIKISVPDKDIPKTLLLERCETEAGAFLYTLLNFELPDAEGRLRIPVITTIEKINQMEFNRNALDLFIEEKVHDSPGHKILFSDFCARFQMWLGNDERSYWTNRRIGKEIPYIKGKAGGEGQLYLGNISFEIGLNGLPMLIKENDRLVTK